MNQINKESTCNMGNDTEIIIELHPKEIQLLKALRNNWKFGEVTILVRDGLPYRLKRVQEFIDLDSNN